MELSNYPGHIWVCSMICKASEQRFKVDIAQEEIAGWVLRKLCELNICVPDKKSELICAYL